MKSKILSSSIELNKADKKNNRYEKVKSFLYCTQVAFNSFIAIGSIFLIIRFIILIKNDVSWKKYQRLLENRDTIEKCANEYNINKCHPLTRLPALREQCDKWFKCMCKDIDSTFNMSSVLWASTIAEILNEFAEKIRLKSILLILTFTISVIVATKFEFGS